MNKSKKRNIIIGSLCAVVLLMAVGYAAFQTVLNISGTSNITSNWNIKITDVTTKNIKGTASNKEEPTFTDTTATFKTNLQSPGDSLEYEVTVTNAGNLNAKVDEVTLSDTNNPAIKFTSSGITKGDVINAGSTGTLLVKVEYLESVTSQPTNTTSDLTVTLDYSQATGSAPTVESAADKLIATAVTSGDGLYEDTYEPGRYVYKGANPNNYITFNDESWRILSVQNDGTLKIRRTESIGNYSWDAAGTRNFDTSTYCSAASDAGCNAWASTKNILDNLGNTPDIFTLYKPNGDKESATDVYSGSVINDASINTYLNSNYYNSLGSTAKSLVVPGEYMVGTPGNYQDGDNMEKNLVQSKSYIWKGNVALVTILEWMQGTTNSQCLTLIDAYESGNTGKCNTANWIFDKSISREWTLSSYVSANQSGVWAILSTGQASSYWASDTYGVRPVLYIKSNITLSGEGTISNPYKID